MKFKILNKLKFKIELNRTSPIQFNGTVDAEVDIEKFENFENRKNTEEGIDWRRGEVEGFFQTPRGKLNFKFDSVRKKKK